jgi:hypothetical protein
MEFDELEAKINEWLAKQDDQDMRCFNCKQPARFVYAPEDLAWGPYFVCESCQNNFDKLLDFHEGKCAPGTH